MVILGTWLTTLVVNALTLASTVGMLLRVTTTQQRRKP